MSNLGTLNSIKLPIHNQIGEVLNYFSRPLNKFATPPGKHLWLWSANDLTPYTLRNVGALSEINNSLWDFPTTNNYLKRTDVNNFFDTPYISSKTTYHLLRATVESIPNQSSILEDRPVQIRNNAPKGFFIQSDLDFLSYVILIVGSGAILSTMQNAAAIY